MIDLPFYLALHSVTDLWPSYSLTVHRMKANFERNDDYEVAEMR